MTTSLPAYWTRLCSVRASDPDQQRRGRLLNILLLLSFALIICLTAINILELLNQPVELAEQLTDILIDFVSGFFMLGLVALNRRGHTRPAAIFFLLGYLGGCLLFFDLRVLEHSLVVWAVPIAASSFILSPRASFMFFGLAGGAYTLIYLNQPLEELYNYISMLGLCLLAILAWQTAMGMEHVLTDVRQLLAREQAVQDKLRAEVGERQRAEEAQRQAAEALERESRLLRTVIDNVPDQIFARDLDGRFILNNRSDAQAMGVSDPETLLGKNDYDFSPPDLAARYQADNRQVMLTGQPLINREELLPSSTGAEPRWGLTTKVPLRDSRGQVIGIVGIARDITDRKRMEEALRASELKFRGVIEQAHDGIALADEHGAIIEWNQAEERITGLPRDRVLGRTFWDVQLELAVPEHQPPDLARQLRDKHRQVFQGQPAPWLNQLQEREIRRVDGECRIIEMLIYPIHLAERFALGCVMRDITDRKRVEEALRQSEDRYRALVEASPDAITLTDLNGRFVMANRRAAEMHGFASADAMLGTPALDLIALEDRQRASAGMLEVLDTGSARNVEYTFLRRDGTRFPVDVSASVVTDAAGNPQAFMGVTRDVTDRKRAAQALEKRARQLALLGEVGSQMAAILELDKVLNTATNLVQQRFGYYHVAIFIHDPDRQELAMTARAGELAERFPLDYALKLGQGLVGWVALHGERLLVNDVRAESRFLNLYPGAMPTLAELGLPIRVGGETIGVLDIQSPQLQAFDDNDVVVMETLADQLAVAIENARLYEAVQRELADRTRTEAELKRRNKDLIALNRVASALSQVAGLEVVLKTALDTVLTITGAETGTIQLSDANLDQTAYVVRRGVEPETLEDMEIIAARESAVTAVMQTGQPLILGGNVVIYRSRTESDQEWLRPCAAILIQSKSRIIGVLVLEGEVVRHWSEQEVQLLVAIGHEIGTVIENTQLAANAAEVQVLREVDRLRSELIANVSHELRTPLGLIKLFSTALLAEGFTFDDATQRQFLTEIDQETDRLEKIVSHLLDVSRLQSGRLRLDKEVVEVGQLIKQVVKRKELQLTQHRLVLDMAASPLLASLDALRIEQVLRNLLENAAKYSPHGGTITVQARGDAHQILVCVRDEGIGIPAGEVDKVFDRFYRVDNELTRIVGGLGLGLSVSRGIVEAHGGRMWVESTLGVGSSFFVSLPVEEAGNGRGPA